MYILHMYDMYWNTCVTVSLLLSRLYIDMYIRALDKYTVYRLVNIQPENCHTLFWFLCPRLIIQLIMWFIYSTEHAYKLQWYSFQYVFMLNCFKNAIKLSLFVVKCWKLEHQLLLSLVLLFCAHARFSQLQKK